MICLVANHITSLILECPLSLYVYIYMYIMRGKRLKHIHEYTIICNKIFLITDRLTLYLYLHIYFVSDSFLFL